MAQGGTIYLQRYIDRVQDVPAYLKRHMALIRCVMAMHAAVRPCKPCTSARVHAT